MADYTQTPGNLNILAVVGDDISISLDFDVVLTGYTFVSEILVQQYGATKKVPFTVTNNNLANGLITLSLTDTQTTAIGECNKCPWYLKWTSSGAATTTVLSGQFTLNRP